MLKLVKPPPMLNESEADRMAVSHLRQLGAQFEVGPEEIARTCELASGPGDIMILLDCPAKRHQYAMPLHEYVQQSPTLQAVDDQIRFGSGGYRSIYSVSVVNSFPMSPKGRSDTKAKGCAQAIEMFIRTKQPKVIVACTNYSGPGELLNAICSACVGSHVYHMTLRTATSSIMIVPSIHPSKYMNYERYNVSYRVLSTFHFVLGFAHLSSSETQIPCWIERFRGACFTAASLNTGSVWNSFCDRDYS